MKLKSLCIIISGSISSSMIKNYFICGLWHHCHPGTFFYFLVITKSSWSTAPGCELPQNTTVSNTTGHFCISRHPSLGDDGSRRQRWNAQDGWAPVCESVCVKVCIYTTNSANIETFLHNQKWLVWSNFMPGHRIVLSLSLNWWIQISSVALIVATKSKSTNFCLADKQHNNFIFSTSGYKCPKVSWIFHISLCNMQFCCTFKL